VVLEYSNEASSIDDTPQNWSPISVPRAASSLETWAGLNWLVSVVVAPSAAPFLCPSHGTCPKKNLCDWSQTLRHFS
jgi:hypothetical protein